MKRNTILPSLLTTALVLAVQAPAVVAGSASSWSEIRVLHRGLFEDVLAAADLVAAEDYGFRPTEEVRSYGELVGHVAQLSFALCAIARDADPPEGSQSLEAEAETLGKQGLVRELAVARDYCDETFAQAADVDAVSARGTAVLSEALFDGQPVSTGAVLAFQLRHLANHWGNTATYLRLLGLVPPSTARAQAARADRGD